MLQPKSGVAQPRRKCGARGAQRPTEARSTSGFRNNQFNAFVLKIDLAEFLLYKMKRLRPSAISRSLLSAIVLLLAVWTAVAQNTGQFSLNESPLPAPTGYVNDYAGVIDAATKQQLETKIDNFKKSSNPSTELAVAVAETVLAGRLGGDLVTAAVRAALDRVAESARTKGLLDPSGSRTASADALLKDLRHEHGQLWPGYKPDWAALTAEQRTWAVAIYGTRALEGIDLELAAVFPVPD